MSTLPHEIWTEILSWVTRKDDLFACSEVCHAWHAIIHRAYLRHNISCSIRSKLHYSPFNQPTITYCGETYPFEEAFFPQCAINKLDIYAAFSRENFETFQKMIKSESCSKLRRLRIAHAWVRDCHGLCTDENELTRFVMSQKKFIENLEVAEMIIDPRDDTAVEFMKKAKNVKHFYSGYHNFDEHFGQFIAENFHGMSLERLTFGSSASPDDILVTRIAEIPSKRRHWLEVRAAVHKVDGTLWVLSFSLTTTNYEYKGDNLILTVEVQRREGKRFKTVREKIHNLDCGQIERKVNQQLLKDFGQPICVRLLHHSRLSESERSIKALFKVLPLVLPLGRDVDTCPDADAAYITCAEMEEERRTHWFHSCKRMDCRSNYTEYNM
uniref:F-box domain-containing protein n=1 Tax=Steinernema glaseri TaxID=37863 RepID=A0A1I7ZR90_9BILA